ncbi:MAG: hypothetical protein ACYTKD_06510 [Planctomycetota bacterium]|jgi:hypothetical protein
MDNMELVEMGLSPAVPGIRPMIAAVGSAIRKTCHIDALKGPVTREQVVLRAQELKGDLLSAQERERVAGLYTELRADYLERHPKMQKRGMKVDITFGIRDVRCLEKSTPDCATPEEVVRRIGRLHGYDLLVEHQARVSLADLRKAVDSGMPVAIRSSRGEKWRILFGYSAESLVYGVPEIIPIDRVLPSMDETAALTLRRHDPRNAVPSFFGADWPLRRLRGDREMGIRIATDFETRADRIIPNNGSIVIEPFEDGRFDAWFFHSGERSVRGLDDDILRILGIAKHPEVVPPETGDLSQDLWNRHYYRKIDLVLGHSKLVEGICIRSDGGVRGIHAALASVICTTDGLGPTTSAMAPGLFWWNARERHLGDELAKLSDEEKEALSQLAYQAQKKYGSRVEGRGKWPFRDVAGNIQETCGAGANLEEALYGIARWHGWDADVEGGRALPYEKYQAALHKSIPILLADNTNKRALVCYGYIDEGDKHYLLICDPLKLKKPETKLNRDNFLPSAGFRFEEFSRDRYVPFFIHNWKDSLKAWDKEIGEIMKKREAKP